MNKREFLEEVARKMVDYPREEVDQILDYYSEIIEEKVEEGMTEEEAVSGLDPVDEMLAELYKDRPCSDEWSEKSYTFTKDIQNIHANTLVDDVLFAFSEDDDIHIVTQQHENHSYIVELKNGTLSVELRAKIRQSKDRKGGKGGLCSFLNFFTPIRDRKELIIRLPEKKFGELKVRTQSGDIEVLGFQFEKMDLHSVSGDISIDVKADVIMVNSTSGDVSMQHCEGNSLSVGSVSGDIEVNDARFAAVHIKGVSSDIELSEFDADDIRLRTISGDIEATLLSPKSFSAKTVSGDIELPENGGSGLFYAETVSGDVEVKLSF